MTEFLPPMRQLIYQLNKEMPVIPMYELDGRQILTHDKCKLALPVGEQVLYLSDKSFTLVQGCIIEDHQGVLYIVSKPLLLNSSTNVTNNVNQFSLQNDYEQRRNVQYGTWFAQRKSATTKDLAQQASKSIFQTVTAKEILEISKKIDQINEKRTKTLGKTGSLIKNVK